ncbi:hypothetical protein ACOMHN_025911 [Nucella lapillus]
MMSLRLDITLLIAAIAVTWVCGLKIDFSRLSVHSPSRLQHQKHSSCQAVCGVGGVVYVAGKAVCGVGGVVCVAGEEVCGVGGVVWAVWCVWLVKQCVVWAVWCVWLVKPYVVWVVWCGWMVKQCVVWAVWCVWLVKQCVVWAVWCVWLVKHYVVWVVWCVWLVKQCVVWVVWCVWLVKQCVVWAVWCVWLVKHYVVWPPWGNSIQMETQQHAVQQGNPCDPSRPFLCRSYPRCVRLLDVCDGKWDCDDGFDEDPAVCFAVSRPPEDALWEFLERQRRWMIPTMFNGADPQMVAHQLTVASSLRDLQHSLGLTDQNVENLQRAFLGSIEGDERPLLRLGMPDGAWPEVKYLLESLYNSGLEF